MATGKPLSISAKTEVLNIQSPTVSKCNTTRAFEQTKARAVAGIVQEYMILCGGTNDVNRIGSDCTALSILVPNQKPINLTLLNQRVSPAAMTLGDRLLITGGYQANELSGEVSQKATEFISLDSETGRGTNERGPVLVQETSSHCLVRINSSLVLNIGGLLSEQRGETIQNFYSRLSIIQGANYSASDDNLGEWRHIGDLPEPRSSHMCGVINTQNPRLETQSGKQMLVVAGGIFDEPNQMGAVDSEDYLTDTVVIWSFVDNPHKFVWDEGPLLGWALCCASLVVSSDKTALYIAGGRDIGDVAQSSIWILRCLETTDCRWSLHMQELRIARSDSVAIMIPHYLTTCEPVIDAGIS